MKGTIKFTVEVNAAPVNLINLKKINPPIAVLRIPKTIPNIILWLVADVFKGFQRSKKEELTLEKQNMLNLLKCILAENLEFSLYILLL